MWAQRSAEVQGAMPGAGSSPEVELPASLIVHTALHPSHLVQIENKVKLYP